MNKIFFDRYTVNIITLAILTLVEAMQIIIILAFIFSFIPIPIPELVHKFYPLTQYDVRLKRDPFFYHVWIGAALGLQGALIFTFRQRLGEERFWRRFCPYICFMSGIAVIQIFAVFKIFLWGNPWWARDLLYVFLGIGILARIFWPECWRLLSGFWAYLMSRTIPRWVYFLMDAAVVFILTLLVFTPNIGQVLARMFTYDKFYHFDSFIMSPAWAHHNGLLLNKDVTSEYSLTISIFFDWLMKLAGGFSYAHAVAIMIILSALYYFLLYGLWRYWMGGFGLAFFAVLLSIKLQFFHWGVVPLIWIYPSATPLRFLPDVFFLFFILRFTQTSNLRWLLAASIVSGLTLAWIVDVGSYMYLVFLLALAACVYQRGIKAIPQVMILGLFPWGIALSVLSIFYGSLVLQASFWQGTTEFARIFLEGWGTLPITEGLKDKQFFAFCMAFVIPVVYTGTLLYSIGMFLFRQSRPHLFMVLICIYGLGLEHYFIHRSGVTSYYAVIIPFIFVLLFWVKSLLSCLEPRWQIAIKIILCVWALTALTTSYLYMYYPNRLNLSGYDWSVEKRFYDQDFDFSQDASLIDRLTAPQDGVPLISSFETKILMQADRRPFFYYFPFMESEHMQGDKQRNFYPHTYLSLQKTFSQLQDEKPLHVFIQTRLFEGPQAQAYEDTHGGFKQLMDFIRQHYQYQSQGQYLTALKLK